VSKAAYLAISLIRVNVTHAQITVLYAPMLILV